VLGSLNQFSLTLDFLLAKVKNVVSIGLAVEENELKKKET
jgi:hypothetical protein